MAPTANDACASVLGDQVEPVSRVSQTPPSAPPRPMNPATVPNACAGYKSVGSVITSVDHDC